MTTANTDGRHLAGRLHELLLRLAGRLPDDLVTEARTWLAAGQHTDVAQALALGAVAGAVPIEPADVELLATVLTEIGAEILQDVPRGIATEPPPYLMAPVAPEILARNPDAVPACLDLTGAYPTPWGADAVDEAAVRAVVAVAGRVRLVGLWRAWRYPASQSPWSPQKRIYLVETGSDVPSGQLPAVASLVQEALAGAGERDPQVEVVGGGENPVYQTLVRQSAGLLWAAGPMGRLRIARTFDQFDPHAGPVFDPDHPTLDGGEQATVLRYLRTGQPVFVNDIRLPDVVDQAQGEVVPTSVYTDGRWIWTDATVYYLERYGIAPDPDLLDDLRERGFHPSVVGSVEIHLAMVELQDGV